MSYLLIGFAIGVMGSLHCAGMCGPIVLAVSGGSKTGLLLHHTGRILSYTLIGAWAGAIGKTFDILGWQQWLSLVLGGALVLVALAPFTSKLLNFEANISGLAIKYQSWIHSLGLPRTSLRFLGGVGNGLLPCGMVYAAMAGAASTYTPWDGALFMVAFGAGTLPIFVALMALGSKLGPALNIKLRRLIPITMFCLGLLLLARGANLGIPYLSLKQSESADSVTDCR